MKIIFLDIDGVLNHQLWCSTQEYRDRCLSRDENDHSCWFCPDTVNLLNSITDDTEAKIVVSSSWRRGRTVEQLKQLLKDNGVKGEVIGKTPDLYFGNEDYTYSVPRGCEIKAWFEMNKGMLGDKMSKVKYIILDDDSDMLYWQRNNFIQVDSYCGLTPRIIDRAIKILNG